ncbi:MAG: 2-oxoacid:acceptor oxidoreductase subunit alpha [Planctomycetes bacterium]|nr:2-oxoacid:acceptor oxidoreductase subunit alpha [Planctomycetota bacterium]
MTTDIRSGAVAGKPREALDAVTIRFAGDSGDGMQLTGTQFTSTSAVVGNDIATLPDFPAEIRAPAGSLPGVSGFQLHFSSRDIRTPGDEPDVLVAMNPAALKVNIGDLLEGGMVIVDTDAFTKGNLAKAGYDHNPLDSGELSRYRVFPVNLTTLNANALAETTLSKKERDRCRNLFALGLLYWLFDRPMEKTVRWIQDKFGKRPEVADANLRALRAGFNYADTVELFTTHYTVDRARLEPGTYRSITGNEATALGFIAAAHRAGKTLFYGSYPITPASDILHELSMHKEFGVKTFQAEDEIAAMGSAIGAAFGGAIALTGTSGPGLALKSEAIGLAVMTELPVVIVDVQRGGPSTGLPTKTEQADLLQAFFGRNGECPVPVVAPATPADCFSMALEAVRIATTYMTPVLYLSDGYLANGTEPWRFPTTESLPDLRVEHWTRAEGFMPYLRDQRTLARPWALPGTPGLEHRIGGLEKADITGNVCYDPDNHHHMVSLRAEKVARVAESLPPLEVFGPPTGRVLVVGWGGTHGAITSAVERLREEGLSVSSVHLRYLNPFQKELGEVLGGFDKVLVPEINLGQLRFLLRARYLVDALGYNRVRGKPLKIHELAGHIRSLV